VKPELAIIIPTLGRSGRLARVRENLRATTESAHEILWVLEKHDLASVTVLQAMGERMVFNEGMGCNAAANTGFRHTTAPVVFSGSDDVVWHPGWARLALARFRPGIGVVGTNDLNDPNVPSGYFSTHNLVLRDYVLHPGSCVDCPGQLYHEYEHGYGDVELVFTARARRAFAPCLEAVVEHVQEKADATGQRNQQMNQRDHSVWLARKHLWERELPEFSG
jgi:hypothetical protein